MLRLWTLIIGLWLLGGLSAAAAPMADSSSKRSSPVLLVLGDSISAGYGIEPGQGWVSLLGQELIQQGRQVQIVNASISGDTTSGGLARLPALLEQLQPRWLVIELGANDGLRGTPLPVIETNLRQLVELGQRHQAKVLLLGMHIPPNYGSFYSNGFFALFEQVAEATGIDYLPFLLQGVGGNDALMQADGLHPNAQAQPLLLANARPLLLTLLAADQ